MDTADLSEAEHTSPEVQALKAEGPHSSTLPQTALFPAAFTQHKMVAGMEEHVGPRVLPTCAAVIIHSHFVQSLFSSCTQTGLTGNAHRLQQ